MESTNSMTIWERMEPPVESVSRHDDVIKWKHFPRYWPFVMFSLICVWINGWVNNGEAGDLRRHRAYYDVIVMDQNIFLDAYCGTLNTRAKCECNSICRILRWHCPAGIEGYRAPVMHSGHESLLVEGNIPWVWKWKNSTSPCLSEKVSYNASPRIYTARQLCGIALLVPPFCLRAVPPFTNMV